MKNTENNKNSPLIYLSFDEFCAMMEKRYPFLKTKTKPSDDTYAYGLKGLADLLGASTSTAARIKKSGILNDAISQSGKTIIINKARALELIKYENYKGNNK